MEVTALDRRNVLVPLGQSDQLAPRPDLGAADRERIARAIEAQRAPRTRTEYANAWARFERWCASRQLQALPAHPETIAAYITELTSVGGARGKPVSVSTVHLALAAIAAVHERDFPLNASPTQSPLIKGTLAGIQREHGRPSQKKQPLLVKDLVTALANMNVTSMDALRDRTLLILAFAGAMRRSEVVALRVSMLAETRLGYVVTLPKSKGDQEGKGQRVYFGLNEAYPSICPARALDMWLEKAKPVDYLFTDKNGKPLDGRHIAALVKLAAQASIPNADPLKFAGHSLRRGHATQAHLDGNNAEAIQRQLRHKDPKTTQGYIEEADAEATNTSINLGLPIKQRNRIP